MRTEMTFAGFSKEEYLLYLALASAHQPCMKHETATSNIEAP
jgi:hypothetical protein